jgi:hypothetical protein
MLLVLPRALRMRPLQQRPHPSRAPRPLLLLLLWQRAPPRRPLRPPLPPLRQKAPRGRHHRLSMPPLLQRTQLQQRAPLGHRPRLRPLPLLQWAPPSPPPRRRMLSMLQRAPPGHPPGLLAPRIAAAPARAADPPPCAVPHLLHRLSSTVARSPMLPRPQGARSQLHAHRWLLTPQQEPGRLDTCQRPH